MFLLQIQVHYRVEYLDVLDGEDDVEVQELFVDVRALDETVRDLLALVLVEFPHQLDEDGGREGEVRSTQS